MAAAPPPAPDTTSPSAPTDLIATAVSTSEIDLSWNASTDNVGVAGYDVYRNGSEIGTTANTSYQDTGLGTGTGYSYTVAAYDAAGNVSAQSGGVFGTTMAATNPVGPMGYTFCADENGTCSFSGTMSVAFGAGTSFYYETLSNGTPCDNAVFGDPDPNVVKACFVEPVTPVSDTTPPSIPTGLIASAVSTSQVNLNWNASIDNVGVMGYRIYRGGSQIATTKNISFADTGLAAGTSYTYAVSAYDAAGNASGQSGSVSVTTQASLPPAPVSTMFTTGERVMVSSGPLNIRETPSTSGIAVGTEATGNLGTVVGGPTNTSGYNWWQVAWNDGLVGWSVENYMAAAPATIPPTPTSTAPSPTPLSIANASLPNAMVGTAYSVQLSASGGTAPYLYADTNCVGSCNTGLFFYSTGHLMGTPVGAGQSTFTFQATDAKGSKASKQLTLTVTGTTAPTPTSTTSTTPSAPTSTAPTPLSIANASLPNAVVGTAYSVQLSASGGTAPYLYANLGCTGSCAGLYFYSTGHLGRHPHGPRYRHIHLPGDGCEREQGIKESHAHRHGDGGSHPDLDDGRRLRICRPARRMLLAGRVPVSHLRSNARVLGPSYPPDPHLHGSHPPLHSERFPPERSGGHRILGPAFRLGRHRSLPLREPWLHGLLCRPLLLQHGPSRRHPHGPRYRHIHLPGDGCEREQSIKESHAHRHGDGDRDPHEHDAYDPKLHDPRDPRLRHHDGKHRRHGRQPERAFLPKHRHEPHRDRAHRIDRHRGRRPCLRLGLHLVGGPLHERHDRVERRPLS